ncbi:hypothetical protein C2E23DRAFT_887794 [Lenzites betulinus]|nr:hypothetical protein C2E23DRAFT_887794 [Lenzites betulinus]
MSVYNQYAATSPVMGHATPSGPYPNTTPQQASSIQPGSITYTTTTGADGRTIYHPFRAVPASYTTATGVVQGIQWIPAEATSVMPINATPAAADFSSNYNRGGQDGRYGQRDDDYRRRNDGSRNSVYDRDRRDQYEDDDYYGRDRDRVDRGDRDRRSSTYGAGGYDKYDTADIERRMRDVDLDRRDRDFERERDRDRTARSRRNSVYGGADRPTSTYQPATGGNYSSTGAYTSPGSTYAPAPGGAYPSSASYHPPSPRPGNVLPRAGSPYRAAGALPRPSSPYQVPIAPRPVSPYQAGAVPRAASPFQAAAIQRAASPYGGPGGMQRAASPSPYGGGIQRAASPYGAGGIQRAASPYGAGGIQRAASPYGGGGVSAYASAMQRGASPYAGAAPLPGGGGVYPPGHVLEGQPLRSHSRAPSPSPYGQTGAVNMYSNPQVSNIYGAPTSGYGASAGGYGNSGIAAHASPRMGGGMIDPQQQASMLTVPEGFARPPNRAQPYTQFDIMKIQDMDEFLDVIPRMPAVLVPHDVYHEDWIRLMQDLAMAWAGTLPVPQYSSDGRAPKRSTLAADVIDLWNSSFFRARGVEMVLYKGRERRSGRHAGTMDMQLPGFDEYDVSSPSESSDDSDSAEERRRDRYGGGAGYGRQAEAEVREERRARRERKAERKRRKMEKKIKKRTKELEKTYAIYLQCVPPLEMM